MPSTSTICSIEARSEQHRNRCNAIGLERNISIYFLFFQSDKSDFEKGPSRKGRTNYIVTPTWQTPPWYPLLLEMSMQFPLLLTPLPDVLLDPQGNKHHLVQNGKLMLAACEVTGNPLRWKEFQAMQPSLYLNQEDRVLLQVTNQPGTSGLAGVIGKKLINFVHI